MGRVCANEFASLSLSLSLSVSVVLLELRSCVKVEVAVLGSKSLIVLTVSVDGNAPLNLNPALLSLGKSLGVVSFNRGK